MRKGRQVIQMNRLVAKKSRRTGGEVVEFLKDKAKIEQSLHEKEMELRRNDQEASAKQQEGVLELLRKQAEQIQAAQAQMAQQQMQMSRAMMVILQKITEK